jgi:hypothetical protein
MIEQVNEIYKKPEMVLISGGNRRLAGSRDKRITKLHLTNRKAGYRHGNHFMNGACENPEIAAEF